MISGREDTLRVSSPRKLSSPSGVVNADHCSINDFRVLEEKALQFGGRYCKGG
jgi:hypothetical protein